MAQSKTLNTTIVLRNDSTKNWDTHSSVVLAKGETGLEFLKNGKVKMKVGDGQKTWDALPYLGAEEAQVFQVTATGEEADLDKINAAVQGKELAPGDMAIVKRTFGKGKNSHTAYVYNGSVWEAMDGNYNAENVYFDKDLTLTASIGVQTVPTNGSKTIDTTGKNIKQVFDMLVAKEVDPVATKPSVNSVTLTGSGAYEVGTTVSPAYTVTFDDGNYSTADDKTTGVNPTAYHVSDGNNTYTEANGSLPELLVTDDTNYKVSATIDYSDGNIPKTNLGNECAAKQIKAGTTASKSSSAVTGFRYTFYGVLDDTAELTSDTIRKLEKKNAPASLTMKAHKGAKRMVVAVPEGGNKIKKVMKTDGLATEVTAIYVGPTTIQVADSRGAKNGLKNYNVWVYQPAAIDAAENHEITLG